MNYDDVIIKSMTLSYFFSFKNTYKINGVQKKAESALSIIFNCKQCHCFGLMDLVVR